MKATITALIYDTDGNEQSVIVEYEYEYGYRNTWRRANVYEVDSVKILTPLTIVPSDLHEDVHNAIALHELTAWDKVYIDCEILTQEKQQAKRLEIMNPWLKVRAA